MTFTVESAADTVLLVNDPRAEWHHNDDTNGLNPEITISNPSEGRYDIWVGTYVAADRAPATLRSFVSGGDAGFSSSAGSETRPDGASAADDPGNAFTGGGPIAARSELVQITLPGGEIRDHDYWAWTLAFSDTPRGPVISQAAGGEIYVAWTTESGYGKVGVLNPDLTFRREIVSALGRYVQDILAHENGFTVLWSGYEEEGSEEWGYRDDHHTLYVSDFDRNGRRRWDTVLVQAYEYEREGDQGPGGDGSDAHLMRQGSTTAAYFTTYRMWDDGVVHQSEYLAFIDEDGRILEYQPEWSNEPIRRGFSWSVSHSFRPHFVFDGERYILATSGDAYPRGMVVRTYDPDEDRQIERVVNELPPSPEGVAYQDLPISTGGAATTDGRTLVLFDSRQRGRSADIVGFTVNRSGTITGPISVTNTPGVSERIPRPARLGSRFLVLYGVDTDEFADGRRDMFPEPHEMESYAMVVDSSGGIVEGPERLAVEYEPRSPVRTLADGSVVFIDTIAAGGGLVNIVRVRP